MKKGENEHREQNENSGPPQAWAKLEYVNISDLMIWTVNTVWRKSRALTEGYAEGRSSPIARRRCLLSSLQTPSDVVKVIEFISEDEQNDATVVLDNAAAGYKLIAGLPDFPTIDLDDDEGAADAETSASDMAMYKGLVLQPPHNTLNHVDSWTTPLTKMPW